MGYALVVTNYNGASFLKRALDSARQSSVRPKRIIVVDDASSTEDACEMVRQQFPEVKTIRHTMNRGPFAARNSGAREVAEEYIIFIDNDVLLRTNTCEKLIGFMEKHPEVGLCSPAYITDNRERMWWNMGYDFAIFRSVVGKICIALWHILPHPFVERLAFPFTLNFYKGRDPLSVDWVAEGCNIVRTEVFNAVEGYDERYFMSHGGPDLCRRIRGIGYAVYFHPEIEIDLLESHTHTPEKRRAYRRQSLQLYVQKHMLHLK